MPEPPQPTTPPEKKSTTVESAVKAFTAEREETLAPNTLRKSRFVLNSLSAHSANKGYLHIERWQPMDVRELRTCWGVSPNTSTTYLEIVKSFFGFCVANHWIAESPAKLVKPAKGRAADNQKERIPFSDEEIERMLHACEHFYGKTPIKWNRDIHHRPAKGETANYRYKWRDTDLADFITLGIHTGLRISDLCLFHIDRLLPSGEVHVRTTKTGRKVYTWILPWLQERIRARAKVHGPFIFGADQTTDINVITDVWRRKLNRLWALCGPWKEKPTPHRLRHTFARILLEKPDVTVSDVAELLGDTEEMVLRHYNAFVPERQARLTKALKAAFSDRPKLVAINRTT